MDLAIVDARQWQNQFVFDTGEKADADNRATQMTRSILERHPYPGDLGREANQ
jgi:hypothetical protein